MISNLWQPTCTIAALRERSAIIQKIRDFFAERKLLEVETPQMSWASVTAPYLASIKTTYANTKTGYLQTSPEYAMKRLLAFGSGDIYQIAKAYRDAEEGSIHNPEFTMLEWYRLGFDHHDLMKEVDELLQLILQKKPADKVTYEEIFARFFDINVHEISVDALRKLANAQGIEDVPNMDLQDKDLWLQLLMTEIIEPQLGQEKPVIIYDFPASQAALAKVREEKYFVASRFEVFFKGIELGNGFHELSDPDEQRRRFEEDAAARERVNMEKIPIDENLLTALKAGLPECAGVALGIDRLIMLALEKSAIQDVIAFPIDRA